jgi:hypothetical protein
VITDQIVDAQIQRLYQAQLFETRICKSPAAPLVRPHPMSKDPSKNPLCLDPPNANSIGPCHPLGSTRLVCRSEAKSSLNTSPELVIAETVRTGRTYRSQCGRTEQRDEEKVVKMPGLQGGILSVVRETQ